MLAVVAEAVVPPLAAEAVLSATAFIPVPSVWAASSEGALLLALALLVALVLLNEEEEEEEEEEEADEEAAASTGFVAHPLHFRIRTKSAGPSPSSWGI